MDKRTPSSSGLGVILSFLRVSKGQQADGRGAFRREEVGAKQSLGPEGG